MNSLLLLLQTSSPPQALPTPSSLNQHSLSMAARRLPAELILHILELALTSSPVGIMEAIRRENVQNAYIFLDHASLVSRAWRRPAQTLLIRTAVVDTKARAYALLAGSGDPICSGARHLG